MSERDPVVVLLKELDRPVAPRPEFADALRAQLLAELAQADGFRVRRRIPRSRLALLPRQRRPLVAGAAALAVAAAAITAVFLSRPSAASAVEVIRQARDAFAAAPPFEATLRVELNPDGSNPDVPRGATATVLISYGGPHRFRTQIASVKPRFPNATGPGSYEVFDGRTIASFDSKRNRFYSSPAPSGFQPLKYFSWRGGYPDWEQVCLNPGSKVLPDARIAGRGARHLRCSDFRGDTWQLWIDRKTGLLLKIVGQVPGDDLFLDLGSGASSKGGFQVARFRLNPSFPAGTFSVNAPSGATDYQARLRAAAASVPPFRAIVQRRMHGQTYVEEAWWLNERSWRLQVLAGQDPTLPGGPGSFVVSAHGSPRIYNADQKTYSSASSSSNPIVELLPEANPTYSTAACPIVDRERIAGRDAVHRRCTSYDVWVDRSTGLLLRQKAARYELRVRSIVYHPTFPPGTFRFARPPGARSAGQRANDPYYQTKLAPGKVAQNWSATTLGGSAFQLADLRGKPALLLVLPDWCPAGDPVCEVFTALQQVHEAVRNKVAIVWVDLQGSAEQARKVVRHNHLTVPVVVDAGSPGAIITAWKIQAYPYWLLLDAHGRAIEARLKPQTTAQLMQLIAKAT